MDPARLDRRELEQHRLQCPDRLGALFARIVDTDGRPSNARTRRARRAGSCCGRRPRRRELLVEQAERDVDVEGAELGERQEVGRAGPVRRPLVQRQHVSEVVRDVGAAVGDPDTSLLVQLGQLALARELDQLGDLCAVVVLRAAEQPDAVVVDHEHRVHMRGVAARGRAADEVHHDVAAARLGRRPALVRQLGERGAGDPAGGEGQRGLLVERQRLGRPRALVAERAAVEVHPGREAAGAAADQRLEQREAGQALVDRHRRDSPILAGCLLSIVRVEGVTVGAVPAFGGSRR